MQVRPTRGWYNKRFAQMIDITMEAYVRDMMVKSIKGVDHV